ncbi:hypothetical protein AB7044_04890 [Providencia stuartii]|uniref:hypothetical protein n=1 Tax=Providencia stuartii TaxID=588 RepID=UPI0034E5B34A
MKTICKSGLLAIAMFAVSACDDFDPMSHKGEFYYSNPTNDNISFKVDNNDYNVLPGQRGIIQLASGKHTLENSQGELFSFMVFDNNNGGIINPNNLVYYTLSEAYVVEGKADRFKPTTYNVTINGHDVNMAVRSANAFVIDANLFKCSYLLGEPFPESITTHDQKLDGNIKSKCFDKAELIEYIANEYGEDLQPNMPGDALHDSINMAFSYELPTADFTDQSVQSIAEELVNLLKQLKETNDTAIHEKLNQQFHQLSIELVKAHTNNSASNSVSDNEQYNNFVHQVGELRGYGIWEK